MYKEKEKKIVREEIIKNSIESITKYRKQSTISNPSHIKKVVDFLEKDERSSFINNSFLRSDAFFRWCRFYDALLLKQKPENLKVAFLSGPNPENDIEILIKYGILEENIWAFESENQIYDTAVQNLIEKYPHIKIINGKIDTFFLNSPVKFDIVYLDFCGPIVNRDKKNKSLKTIIELVKCHVLNSPGVLVTNFSLPTEEQDTKGRRLLEKLAALYLYPKKFINDTLCISEQGYGMGKWFDIVKKDFDYLYGEFITRLIMDISSVIVPFTRLARNEAYYKDFFDLTSEDEKRCIKNLIYYDENGFENNPMNYENIEVKKFESLDDLFNENANYKIVKHNVLKRNNIYEDCGGWLMQECNEYALPWTLTALELGQEFISAYRFYEENEYNSNIDDFFDKDFINFAKSFLGQISSGELKYIDKIKIINYMLFTESSAQYSEKLKKIYDADFNKPPFCDVFTFHSVVGLLLGQVCIPYHINVKKTKRWSYKARSLKMYTDMYIFDECRYIYDMMPTIDMIVNSMDNIEYQLCYRFALDALNKNQFYYNEELFPGNAVVGINHTGFEASVFTKRINIKD